MVQRIYNLARVTTATTGTGTITLGAAVSGFLTFANAGIADQDVVSYGIRDGANSEIGFGLYTASGTTLTRNVTNSTNANAAITLSGAAEVFITARAEEIRIRVGTMRPTIQNTAEEGWILMNDSTIGSASSGSSRANADTKPLFTLIYTNLTDAIAPIKTSANGATTRAAQTNAATAWTNNCRITLPLALGRAMGCAGAGSGLTSRALGFSTGTETHQITEAQLASHRHILYTSDSTGGNLGPATNSGSTTSDRGTSWIELDGSDQAHPNVQPTTFVNWEIKL